MRPLLTLSAVFLTASVVVSGLFLFGLFQIAKMGD